MTENAEDPHYLFILRHPATGERRARVGKLLILNDDELEEKWTYEQFYLAEIYRLRESAWEEWRAFEPASRPPLGTKIPPNIDDLVLNVKQLETYARKLDGHIVNLEGQGLIRR